MAEGCRRLVVRNLPHDFLENEFVEYLAEKKSCHSFFESSPPRAVLTSYKRGKAANAQKEHGVITATAFLSTESLAVANVIAAALDGVAIRPQVDGGRLVMSVEYAPYQEGIGALDVGGPDENAPHLAGAAAVGTIFTDPDYIEFVKVNVLDKTAPGGTSMATSAATQKLDTWVAEQKEADESRKSTALVSALIGKWFQNIPFAWEQRKALREGGTTPQTDSSVRSKHDCKKDSGKKGKRHKQKELSKSSATSPASSTKKEVKSNRSDAADDASPKVSGKRRNKHTDKAHDADSVAAKTRGNHNADERRSRQKQPSHRDSINHPQPQEKNASSKPERKNRKSNETATPSGEELVGEKKRRKTSRSNVQHGTDTTCQNQAAPPTGRSSKESQILHSLDKKEDRKQRMVESEKRRQRKERLLQEANEKRMATQSSQPTSVPTEIPAPRSQTTNTFTVSNTRRPAAAPSFSDPSATSTEIPAPRRVVLMRRPES